jgi:hypothetical protein
MEQFAHLRSSQQEGLKKLMSLIGPDGVGRMRMITPNLNTNTS